jgi:hypothetical protein
MSDETEPLPDIMEARHWRKAGWIARVIKNGDDDGWAVAMTRIGDEAPALIGPWTMGRDKKNPKPLDINAFNTLVKTASEVIRRHEQAEWARLHKVFRYTRKDGTNVLAKLDVVPDEFDPHAILKVTVAETDELLSDARVRPDFKLNATSLERHLRDGDDD